ncbi:hypothetical protein [Nocardia sp. NPDC052566]|uniref:hypothetical protein n=1 Tax=Nocardia sp. NPDC052566 TaxID=3364330 RepID=UPI0037C7CC2B
MRRIGDVVDAMAAFLGAAVAGIALFLPITFSWPADSTPYRVASLINSVPRGAALGMIVGVAVAVVVTTFGRPVTGWLLALVGGGGLLINHIAGSHVSSAEMLTTQNYVDAVCAGALLGALGAAVLRRPVPAMGFALGTASFLIFSDVAELLEIADNDPYAVLEAPPRWLIVVALIMLFLGACHNRSTPKEPNAWRVAVELPITPILAAMVLGLVMLSVFEWLARQYEQAPDIGHGVDVGLAVVATVLAATAAAMLLPGRDGAGVYLAVSLITTADAFGDATRPTWNVLGMIALTAVGLAAGIRFPSYTLAITVIGVVGALAIFRTTHDNAIVFVAGGCVLATVAGYCCSTVHPRYAPSAVLALAALYLPSIVTAMPLVHQGWPSHDLREHTGTPGTAALAVTLCSAVGLAVLYRIRPRSRSRPAVEAEDETFADT